MKVVLIVTSPRDSMCGVADYTYRLASALEGLSASVTLEQPYEWSLNAVMDLRRKYRGARDIVFHMQYPSLFMGNSLSPALLPVVLPNLFVTMHEFRVFSIPRKMIFASHSLLARKIIFSNDGERAIFQSAFPWSGSRLEVIPIGNNIPQLSPREPGPERLVYFGQISRNKGIEFFFDTVGRLREQGSALDVRMVGAMTDKDPDFVAMVNASVVKYGVTQRLNLSSEEVSKELSAATIALLPFPDGISDKRGSALAALDHGVTVLTTHAEGNTPAWLRSVTHGVEAPDDAAGVIAGLMDGSVMRQSVPDILSREMLARDWNQIARTHLALYEKSMR